MIRIDRKIARLVIRESGKRYDTIFLFDGSTPKLFIVPYVGSSDPIRSVDIAVPQQDIPESINRLTASGHLKKESGIMHNGSYFSMTPLLLHRYAFWIDAFTKKFWYGFLSGVITSVVAGVLLQIILKSV